MYIQLLKETGDTCEEWHSERKGVYFMEKKVDVHRILHHLIMEYEKIQGKMRFSFQKRKNEFVFTEGSLLLLQAFHLIREDFIDLSLWRLCQNSQAYQKLYHLYEQAWSGRKVVYYVSSPAGKLYIALLYPIQVDGITREVEGKCVILPDYQVPALQDTQYLFESTDFMRSC